MGDCLKTDNYPFSKRGDIMREPKNDKKDTLT